MWFQHFSRSIIVLSSMCIFVLVGCASPDSQVNVTQSKPPSITVEPLVTQLADDESILSAATIPPTSENTLTIKPTNTSAQATETKLPPTPRQNLEATDPSVVKLASGRVQLIEFFAFW